MNPTPLSTEREKFEAWFSKYYRRGANRSEAMTKDEITALAWAVFENDLHPVEMANQIAAALAQQSDQPLQAALMRLSMAMGNPAVEIHDTIEAALIDHAITLLTERPDAVPAWSGRVIEVDYETHRAIVRYEGHHPAVGVDVQIATQPSSAMEPSDAMAEAVKDWTYHPGVSAAITDKQINAVEARVTDEWLKAGQGYSRMLAYGRAVLALAAPAVRWANFAEAVPDPLYQQCRGIMGTTNAGQDQALFLALQKFEAASLPAALSADAVDARTVHMVAEWIEEALTYVGSPSWSPSMVRDGQRILAALSQSAAAAKAEPAAECKHIKGPHAFGKFYYCAKDGCVSQIHESQFENGAAAVLPTSGERGL